MIDPISQLHRRDNSRQPEWRFQSADLPLVNPRIGFVQHVVVLDSAGQVRYDQPVITCRPGPVCVVLTQDGRLALLRHFRPIPLDPAVEPEYPIRSFGKMGLVSLEFPRGGAEAGESMATAATREVEEEVGFKVTAVKELDRANADTAFFPISITTFVVTIDTRQPSERCPDPLEDTEVTFVSHAEFMALVAAGQILCSQTKAAYLSYLASEQAR